MKSKFILYVIALLLFFNVVFQFKHGTQLNGFEEKTRSEIASLKADISSLEKSLGQDLKGSTKQLTEAIKQLQGRIDALQRKNFDLEKKIVEIGRKTEKHDKRLFPPPQPRKPK